MRQRSAMTAVRAAAVLLAMSATALAQAAPNKQPPPATAAATAVPPKFPAFSTRTEMVLVPVVVNNGAGEHVSGLKKEDFVVKENGKPQTVTVFEEIKAAPAARVKKDLLPPGAYSNFLEEQTPKRLVIIAIDMINTPLIDQAYAREQLVKFLSENLDPGTLISLVAIGRGRMRMIHDFTSDPALLIAALRKVRGQPPAIDAEAAVADAAALQQEADIMEDFLTLTPGQFLAAAGARAAFGEQRLVVLDTLSAIQQLAQAYAGVPGRKALLWATAGFPFTLGSNGIESARGFPRDGLSDVIRDYEKTWDLLNNANMALYPVDARGLVNTAWIPASVGFSAQNARAADSGRQYLRAQQARHLDTIATMQTFAEMTGGQAFYNTNDLSRSFRRAAEDSAAYYLLGYYLEKNSKPGWHKLKVEVQRAGVHLRARNGFFVTPGDDPNSREKRDIAQAMGSPLDFSGLPFTVKFEPATPMEKSANRRVPFSIILPLGAVAIDEADSNHTQVEFVGMARTHDGQPVGDFAQTMEGHLKPESVEQIRTHGLAYNYAMELPPGEYSLRFVVRDGVSGRIGSLTAPLRVQ